MVTTILSHEVKNYSDWKKGFDAGEAQRVQAGVKSSSAYNSVDNPNYVTVIAEFPSAEAVRGFMANPELQANLEKAGVIGKPDFKILSKM